MRLDDVVALIDILFDGNQRCRLVRDSQGALPEICDRIRPDLLSPVHGHQLPGKSLSFHFDRAAVRNLRRARTRWLQQSQRLIAL